MRLFGLQLPSLRRKAAVLSSVDGGRGWISIFDGPTPGGFQRDLHIDPYRVQTNGTIFACQTLIAGDFGKLEINLVEEDETLDIYTEVDVPAFSPVLRKPNDYQTWPKFIQQWILSKLSHGNAYILKERDQRNVVVAMYVLDPWRVHPLVSTDGSVYYELGQDWLAHVPAVDTVPASEIMHDRMWCLFHPLVGLSPLFACGLAAIQGLEIQKNSERFFANQSRPSGMLVTPRPIDDVYAKKIKDEWEKNYVGAGAGRTAVLANGLEYKPMTQNAVDSELVAQLKMSAEMICSTYHVPAYKVGVGATPTYQNAEVLNQIYYDDCLQTLIEDVEAVLGEGLGLPNVTGRSLCLKFDLDGLLRMDSATQVESLNNAVKGGWMSPDEARAKRNMRPVAGGSSPMMQQQNYSLAALAKRDATANPFATQAPAAPANTAPAANDMPTPDPNADAANKAADNVLSFGRFRDKLRARA